MFNCLHKLVFFIREKQDIFIPGGKFLGLIDDFRMETTNIVAKATPIKKNADISALTPFKFNLYTCLKNSSDSWSTTQTTNSENLVFQIQMRLEIYECSSLFGAFLDFWQLSKNSMSDMMTFKVLKLLFQTSFVYSSTHQSKELRLRKRAKYKILYFKQFETLDIFVFSSVLKFFPRIKLSPSVLMQYKKIIEFIRYKLLIFFSYSGDLDGTVQRLSSPTSPSSLLHIVHHHDTQNRNRQDLFPGFLDNFDGRFLH